MVGAGPATTGKSSLTVLSKNAGASAQTENTRGGMAMSAVRSARFLTNRRMTNQATRNQPTAMAPTVSQVLGFFGKALRRPGSVARR